MCASLIWATTSNSRGAADMGLLPDLLPGYVPVSAPGAFADEYAGMPATPGKTSAAKCSTRRGKRRTGCAAGRRRESRAAHQTSILTSFESAFVIVQDIFLTETAALGRCGLPCREPL